MNHVSRVILKEKSSAAHAMARHMYNVIKPMYRSFHTFASDKCTWCAHLKSLCSRKRETHRLTTRQFYRPYITVQHNRQNGRHFADELFQIHFFERKCGHFDQNFTKNCPRGTTDNQSALVKVMVWRRASDNPLSEPVVRKRKTYTK